MILDASSPLRALPAGLNAKQALFFSGLRQNAEIALFSYERLLRALTEIAQSNEHSGSLTGAFADAWSVVDAIDRFRALRLNLPNATFPKPQPGDTTFAERTQPIRDIRNFNDHIAQRADQIIASGTPSLGALTWFTIMNTSPFEARTCLLAPGALQSHQTKVVNPATYMEQRIRLPTDKVHLEAGGVVACLSEAVEDMSAVVADIEEAMSACLRTLPPTETVAADLLVVVGLAEGSSTTPTA